jgi:hypothetical protein
MEKSSASFRKPGTSHQSMDVLEQWGEGPTIRDGLAPLLQNPSVTLEDVLRSSYLTATLRCEDSDRLAEFLLSDDNMRRISTYALTDSDQQLQKICVAILSTSAHRLQAGLRENLVLLDALASFPTGPSARDPRICGYFARICDLLIRSTGGSLLQTKFSFLQTFLAENLDLLALRDLFVHFLIDFKEFDMPMDLLCEMAIDDSQKSLFVLFTMRDCLKEKPEFFQSFHVIHRLLTIGEASFLHNPAKCVVAYSLVDQILAKSDKSFAEVLELFHFPADGPVRNCATAAALRLFPVAIEWFIDAFLTDDLPTAVNDAICSGLTNMGFVQLQSLVCDLHLNRLIGEAFVAYRQRKVNGHFLMVAKLLRHRELVCCRAHAAEWDVFCRETMARHAVAVAAPYGGPLASALLHPTLTIGRILGMLTEQSENRT